MSEATRPTPMPPAPRSTKRRAVFGVLLLLGVYVVLDVVSAGAGFVLERTGWLRAAQTAPLQGGAAEVPEQRELDEWDEWDSVVLHPYVGFARDPDFGGTTSYGFPGKTGHLFDADPDSVLIAITGGSLAEMWAENWTEAFVAAVGSAPSLEGRKIRVMCLAMGAYKQPQQLLALSYMLSIGIRPDIVVNLDGFNDVANGHNRQAWLRGVIHPSHPAPVPWLHIAGAQLSLSDMALLGEVHLLRRRQAEQRASLARLRFSFTARLVARLLDQRLEGKINSAQVAASERVQSADRPLTFSQTGPHDRIQPDELDRYLLDLWVRGSLQMHRLASANGIAYVHLLQPNQYVPGSKDLTAWERANIYDEDGPWKAGVLTGYPLLRAGGETLTAQGVDFHDLTQLFVDDGDKDIYIDSCCHIGRDGNEILTREIADVLAERLAASPVPRPGH